MARLTNGDDMLTFWSRAQYMRREVEPDVRGAAARLPTLPAVVLADEEAGAKAVGVVHDERRSRRLRETTNSHRQFVSPMRRRGRGRDELAEQTDVHLKPVTYPKEPPAKAKSEPREEA